MKYRGTPAPGVSSMDEHMQLAEGGCSFSPRESSTGLGNQLSGDKVYPKNTQGYCRDLTGH